jgi:hypothetical protein
VTGKIFTENFGGKKKSGKYFCSQEKFLKNFREKPMRSAITGATTEKYGHENGVSRFHIKKVYSNSR